MSNGKEASIIENAIGWELREEKVDWESGERLSLPEGVKVKVLYENKEEKRVDMLIRFPKGYVEPEHTHEASHAVLILDGQMLVHGHELTSGDYLFGQEEPHGPMEYLDGCIVFASFVGGSPSHQWDEDQKTIKKVKD